MKRFKNLVEFTAYCEDVLKEENDNWLLSLLTPALSIPELAFDILKCYDEYYKWLKIAVDTECYYLADIIKKALEEEEEHYKNLARGVNMQNIQKEFKSINDLMKKKYLNINE